MIHRGRLGWLMSRQRRARVDPDADRYHRHFEELDRVVKQAGIKLKSDGRLPSSVKIEAHEEETEEDLFDRAMRNVYRPTWRTDSLPSRAAPPMVTGDPELEDLR